MTIADGPLAGWDIAITHIPHGVDAMDDLYTLDLWPPGAGQAAHAFQTYRYAYGWAVVQAAVPGGDAQMQAALDWWIANNDSPAYAIHRILVAIDETTWATRDEIAERLRLAVDDLDLAKPYGQALATAEQHQFVTWRNQRATPLIALTPTGYDLIHPDEPQALASQQQFLDALNASASVGEEQPSAEAAAPPASTVSRAFRQLRHVSPQITTPVPVSPPAGSDRPTRSTR
jgi:hypothetical protein